MKIKKRDVIDVMNKYLPEWMQNEFKQILREALNIKYEENCIRLFGSGLLNVNPLLYYKEDKFEDVYKNLTITVKDKEINLKDLYDYNKFTKLFFDTYLKNVEDFSFSILKLKIEFRDEVSELIKDFLMSKLSLHNANFKAEIDSGIVVLSEITDTSEKADYSTKTEIENIIRKIADKVADEVVYYFRNYEICFTEIENRIEIIPQPISQ